MTDIKQKKSRRGEIQYSSNPFISNAVANTKVGVKRISSKGGEQMLVINQNSGEVIAPAGFWHAQEVDRSQFVKLFVNGVKALKELTAAGTKVFEILYMRVQENIGKDVVYISYLDIDQALTPMSESTYMRGMKELVVKGFIAETIVSSKYFINPDYMFNGDRLAFVREFRVKAANAPKDQLARENLEAKGQTRLIQ